MSVTLSEVKRAAIAHRAALAGESAGYLVLAIADQVRKAPRLVQAADIELSEDGELRVLSARASAEADAELSLRRVLEQLLLVASSGSAALTRAGRRTSPVGLTALVRELEAALIPVNWAAARRALARVHRETARALSSGLLPEAEALEASAFHPVEIALGVQSAGMDKPATDEPAPDEPELDEPTPETGAQTNALPSVREPERLRLNGALTALCQELPAGPEARASAALSVPLDEPAPPLEFEVEFECDAVDSGAAPTVMRAIAVQPVGDSPSPAVTTEQSPVYLPTEACTRPEPIVLRKSLPPVSSEERPSKASDESERTPTLGSLATHLPVLLPEQIAERSSVGPGTLAAAPAGVATDCVVCSAPHDERTEQMPEVAPLGPEVPMVPSRKSDVLELVSAFRIEPDGSHPGLCRAIKEMADLDLTPGPFAALIRDA